MCFTSVGRIRVALLMVAGLAVALQAQPAASTSARRYTGGLSAGEIDALLSSYDYKPATKTALDVVELRSKFIKAVVGQATDAPADRAMFDRVIAIKTPAGVDRINQAAGAAADEALSILTRAAEQNDRGAQVVLGMTHRDLVLGRRIARANTGLSLSAEAQPWVGMMSMVLLGADGGGDLAVTEKMFKAASDAGDPRGMLLYAVLLEGGWGQRRDMVEAVKLRTKRPPPPVTSRRWRTTHPFDSGPRMTQVRNSKPSTRSTWQRKRGTLMR